MTDTPSLMPQGVSHQPDLSALPVADRIKHHTRQLRYIALHKGIEGVKAYKAEHPEAATLRIHSSPVAYVPKPKGYADAMAELVSGWFNSDAAMRETNRSDVARLNTRLATERFDPDRQFSKPLSSAVLAKIEAVFVANGAAFDRQNAKSMSGVRKAVAAAKTGSSQSVAPQAIRRAGNTVTVGACEFPVETHSGHQCIRVPVAGKRVRIRLDALTEVLTLSKIGSAGDPQTILLRSRIGDLAPNILPEDIPQRNWPEPVEQDPQSPEDLALYGEQVPLRDRIKSLAKHYSSPAPVVADGVDVLSII